MTEVPEIHKGGPLQSELEAFPTSEKLKKSNIFLGGWGGSGHPNFMNPFKYGKSFLDKLFTKNPKYKGRWPISKSPQE